MDDGELFLEYSQSESLAFDDGTLRHAGFNTASGLGLRAVKGETVAYAHASEISEAALKRAAQTVRAAAWGPGWQCGGSTPHPSAPTGGCIATSTRWRKSPSRKKSRC